MNNSGNITDMMKTEIKDARTIKMSAENGVFFFCKIVEAVGVVRLADRIGMGNLWLGNKFTYCVSVK